MTPRVSNECFRELVERAERLGEIRCDTAELRLALDLRDALAELARCKVPDEVKQAWEQWRTLAAEVEDGTCDDGGLAELQAWRELEALSAEFIADLLGGEERDG